MKKCEPQENRARINLGKIKKWGILFEAGEMPTSVGRAGDGAKWQKFSGWSFST